MSAAADRIDVLDEAGRSIGWVDPRSGARNPLDPAQAKEFGEMVDFWMTTAGVDGPDEDGSAPTDLMSVSEVVPRPTRHPESAIPLRPLG